MIQVFLKELVKCPIFSINQACLRLLSHFPMGSLAKSTYVPTLYNSDE